MSLRRLSLVRWLDSWAGPEGNTSDRSIDWIRVVPFVGIHLACVAVLWVGVSGVAVALTVGLYLIRMFAITGFYHRYFSHRAFKTSRPFQFLMAVIGNSAVQRGPLWWAAHHRHHHGHSDQPEDLHSPSQGFFQSHMSWFLTRAAFGTRRRYIPDLLVFPELRFLDRFDWVVPVGLGAALYALGIVLERTAPGLGTSGAQLLVWGFAISTVLCFHATYTINSLSHRYGSQRFDTGDDSRNNLWLALLTLGEGWHNNHHHYAAAARQGFYWWEIDLTYYGLRALTWFGLVWDLRPVPAAVLKRNLLADPADSPAPMVAADAEVLAAARKLEAGRIETRPSQ